VLCCDNFSYLPPLANSDHCIVSFNLAVSLSVTSVADEQLESIVGQISERLIGRIFGIFSLLLIG
jgi:hypothetical protein